MTEKPMRERMLENEELSEEEFERLAHRIALEAHEDRLSLAESLSEAKTEIERLQRDNQWMGMKLAMIATGTYRGDVQEFAASADSAAPQP